ncbi:hypothetical protein TIFTF001_004571 [Ficus carica]|uniref:Uncharacterized protein n=1 Tax=Ficus carica TaxID=3494 RepID=A0AA87ZC41_FICCA|nr:hypothetical protein TIFTF001_004571 [Ficus carica]
MDRGDTVQGNVVLDVGTSPDGIRWPSTKAIAEELHNCVNSIVIVARSLATSLNIVVAIRGQQRSLSMVKPRSRDFRSLAIVGIGDQTISRRLLYIGQH